MGLRSSIIRTLIGFLENKRMTMKWSGEESSLFPLTGGGPQGSGTGQARFVVASDDNATMVEEDDRYKYCNYMSILELVFLADVMTELIFESIWLPMLG